MFPCRCRRAGGCPSRLLLPRRPNARQSWASRALGLWSTCREPTWPLRSARGKAVHELVARPWAVHGRPRGRPSVARPVMLQCRPAQEFSFGPRALKDALLSTDPALRQLYTSAFSPAERLFLAEAYNPQRTFFCTLLIRTAFDWLLSRPEVPEDFEAFHAALAPRKQSPARKHIYLQPIGTCSPWVPAARGYLQPVGTCSPWVPAGMGVDPVGQQVVMSWGVASWAIRAPRRGDEGLDLA